MGCEWEKAKIEGVAEKVAMGPFGSSIKISTFVSEGIPVISGQHLNEVRLHDNEYNFITIDHADKLKNSNVYRGDVIFTHAGNIGQVAYIPENSKYERYIISQRQFYMRCDLKRILPSFVAYYFKSPKGRHRLLANTSSTGVPSISRPVSYLRTIEVPVPPLPEQHAISHILGSLGDKIELNHKMNETLEEMARAIFKSWFVDFDPVRAKAKGRHTGLPKEISDLFPDSFQDSDLGEIPKGWEVLPLPEIIDVNPLRTLKKDQIAPYLEMKNMPEYSARVTEWYDRQYKSGSRFTNGDTLMARITPCLENGKGAFVDFLEDGQVGWGSTEYIVLRSKEPLPNEYCYFLTRTKELRNHAIVNMTGSSGRQRVPVSSFNNFFVVNPEEKIAKTFGSTARTHLEKMKKNDEESKSLVKMCDMLLPKLVSGELRIHDIEKFLEEAGL